MAQRNKTVSRRVRVLARRYGWVAKGSVLVVCVAMVAVMGIAVAGAMGQPGVTIERSDQGEAGRDSVAETNGEEKSHSVLVHVDGAVANPGVYELSGESPRVNDAVVSAGGLVDGADTTSMNLAAPVSDGEKVHVPSAGEEVSAQAADVPVAEGPGGVGASSQTTGLVNINTANEAELQTLSGVGEATASAIVRDRTSNGPFSSPEDLMRVTGIGEKKFEKLKGQICV